MVLPLLVAVALLALACSNANAPGPSTTTASCPPVTGDTASGPGPTTTTTTPSCLPAADDTDTPTEGPSNEWRGTFAGTVTWDCGPMGERTGRLTGEYKITTDAIGHALMGGTNTVTGSCAGPATGTLTTPISVEGKVTEAGFEFPGNLWGPEESFTISASGDRGSGVLEGPAPGPATINLVFEIER